MNLEIKFVCSNFLQMMMNFFFIFIMTIHKIIEGHYYCEKQNWPIYLCAKVE